MNLLCWAACLVSVQKVSSTEKVTGASLDVALRARIGGAHGDAGSGLDYRDFFSEGTGVSLEAGWLSASDAVGVGAWGSVAFDHFGGEGYSDDFGDSVSVESLDRLLVLAGGRVRIYLEEPLFQRNPIFVDFRLGGGVARYEEVDGVFRVGGTVRKGVEVFDAGLKAAAEAAVTAGVSSRTFSFGFGVAIRGIDGPGRGSGASDVVDPGAWVEAAFEFGWEYRF